MDYEARKKKLAEITLEPPAQTGLQVYYQGEPHTLDAHMIPLEYLIFNKYNGRISANVKTFEIENHDLNPEVESDCRIIMDFLMKSDPEHNNYTRNDIYNKGQQRYGIVTNDGRIIDGNRRACLLKSLYEDESIPFDSRSKYSKFMAIILPEDVTDKDIMYLETQIQMGEDDKVDYDPLSKYLKAKDLKNSGFGEKTIATAMGTKEPKIKEYLATLEIMEEYLEYIGTPKIYTRLSKREDHFLHIYSVMKRADKKSIAADWGYEDDDVSELKYLMFDFVRAQYEGKEFRDIIKIFGKKAAWDKLRNFHDTKVAEVKAEEKSVNDVKQLHPDQDITKITESIDKDFETKVGTEMQETIRSCKNIVQALENDQPLKNLDNAYSEIALIDRESKSFDDPDILVKLNRVKKLIEDLTDYYERTYNGKH